MERSRAIYERWRLEESLPEELKEELQEMEGEEGRIHDAFYRELTFGTSGLRGIMGAGINRINEPMVAKVSKGLADHIWKEHGRREDAAIPSVAISYDSRKNSRLFAEKTAKILLTRGIKVYMYRYLMPVPALSYGVRRLACDFGVMITASHNPKNYNGYKVYDHTGAQIRGEVSEKILDCISGIDIFGREEEASLDHELFSYIDEKLEEEFVESCYDISIKTQDIGSLNIVYTPLNGTGNLPVRKLLSLGGIGRVHIVPEQENPDSDFTTCPVPNPELKEVYEKGLELAQRVGGDIVIATDPDCDRVGVVLNRRDGAFYPTGNQMAILLMDYLVRSRAISGNQVALRTITGTPMIDAIAAWAGIRTEKSMVGFKHIGEKIQQLGDSFFFAFEEGNGYLAGTHVRDKDGISTALLIAQMTAYHKAKGMDLKEALDQIYSRLGYYEERIHSHVLEGFTGSRRMERIMGYIWGEKRSDFLGKKPEQVTDYLSGETYYFGSGGRCDMSVGTRPTRMPKSDIVEFVFDDGSKVMIRPSGTEPKIKIYLFSRGESREAAAAVNDENEKGIKEIIDHEQSIDSSG